MCVLSATPYCLQTLDMFNQEWLDTLNYEKLLDMYKQSCKVRNLEFRGYLLETYKSWRNMILCFINLCIWQKPIVKKRILIFNNFKRSKLLLRSWGYQNFNQECKACYGISTSKIRDYNINIRNCRLTFIVFQD